MKTRGENYENDEKEIHDGLDSHRNDRSGLDICGVYRGENATVRAHFHARAHPHADYTARPSAGTNAHYGIRRGSKCFRTIGKS